MGSAATLETRRRKETRVTEPSAVTWEEKTAMTADTAGELRNGGKREARDDAGGTALCLGWRRKRDYQHPGSFGVGVGKKMLNVG